jgi:hypothetical protein
MPSPKSKRTAPTQDFDKYVFTRVVGPGTGLFPIASSKMNLLPGGIYSNRPGYSGLKIDVTNQFIPIGFKFKFNEKIYTKFAASTAGWMLLQLESDSSNVTSIIDDYFTPTADYAPEYNSTFAWVFNHGIKSSFTKEGVLLCPWFDYLQTTFTDINHVTEYDNISESVIPLTTQQKDKINKGITLPPLSYNVTNNGIRYANTISPDGQNCLIVRWKSFTTGWRGSEGGTVEASIIEFETVIYENGKIEFRYDSRSSHKGGETSFSDINFEGATIGIFANNDPITGWRYRDFSVGLGHQSDFDPNKKISKYGGAVYNAGFSDQSYNILGDIGSKLFPAKPYVNSLQAAPTAPPIPGQGMSEDDPYRAGRIANWPGQERFGCIFSFSPPENRRKVLPKKELQKRDSRITLPTVSRTGTSYPQSSRLYDDRKSLVYGTNAIVDFPTTLPRGYTIDNSDTFVRDRINLYADFEVTGSITKAGTESFLQNSVVYTTPFSDHNRPEQAENVLNDSYYLTGSTIDQFGLGFSSPLRSKTQIKLELPLNHELKMFDVTSSIYYYNNNAKGLFVPQIGNASNDLADALQSINTASFGYWEGWISEDARGFGPIGNVISSGSNSTTPGPGWSSDENIGFGNNAGWLIEESVPKLTKKYTKSVQNNRDYFANNDEKITIPINQPFLLEKAVFEIPIKAGEGWFNDRTTTSIPIGWNRLTPGSPTNYGLMFQPDFAGPAITVSLYNQIETGLETYRDLILTGTIIPEGDNEKTIIVRKTALTNSVGTGKDAWIFGAEGFLGYGSSPGAIVKPNSQKQFTGSIVLPTIPGVSNGFLVSNTLFPDNFPTATNYSAWASDFIELMSLESIPVAQAAIGKSGLTQNISIIYNIDPFGRSSKGFDPSGRSYFGKEYATYQGIGTKVPNPMFVSSSFDQFPSYIKNVLDIGVNPNFIGFTAFNVPLIKVYDSPYLLLPGDKLTLAISKMRPVMHTLGTDPSNPNKKVDYWRSGSKHDICITTGSIKITLYGSLIKEEKEFHDTLNQPLASDAIHELIGTEPVLDQFEVEYKDSLFGSYTDDYITGSLASLGSNSTIKVGSRGRVFSKLNVRNQPAPDTSAYELAANSSKAFRLQPWYERVGDQRIVTVISSNERFYDSVLPDMFEILQANGSKFALLKDASDMFSNPSMVDSNEKYGVMFFDIPEISTLALSSSILNNNTWTSSFPFEPKYSHITRKRDTKFETFATKATENIFNLSTHTITDISPTKVKPFFGRYKAINVTQGSFDFICDVNLYSNTTGSATPEDTTKFIFGFGDKNEMQVFGSTIFGDNQQPSFRDFDFYTLGGIRRSYSFGPMIRGWKYGIYNGLPAYNKIIFRRNRYGQFRDMLEQRLDSKFFQTEITEENPNVGVLESPISVKFVDSQGKITPPENTWSQNLSFEVTSSMPYFDGITKNRSTINTNIINQALFAINTDGLRNIVI